MIKILNSLSQARRYLAQEAISSYFHAVNTRSATRLCARYIHAPGPALAILGLFCQHERPRANITARRDDTGHGEV